MRSKRARHYKRLAERTATSVEGDGPPQDLLPFLLLAQQLLMVFARRYTPVTDDGRFKVITWNDGMLLVDESKPGRCAMCIWDREIERWGYANGTYSCPFDEVVGDPDLFHKITLASVSPRIDLCLDAMYGEEMKQ